MPDERPKKHNLLGTFVIASIAYIVLGVFMVVKSESFAEVINVIGHVRIADVSHQPDMFFITPYYPSTQVIFSDIAARCGIAAEIVIYLALIVTGSGLLWLLERRLLRGGRS